MAWRPTQHLIEGELDNTHLGRVTGWMRFAGLGGTVRFDLKGDFHRDIRGAKLHLMGPACADETCDQARQYMDGFALEQVGRVGDITAGLPPYDYVDYPYVEWYSDANGRVVIEVDHEHIEVIGKPIPACESDPISREQQNRNMVQFLGELSTAGGVVAVAPGQQLLSDPSYTHWISVLGRVVGEAREVRQVSDTDGFAYLRLFDRPDTAGYGPVPIALLRRKTS